VSQVYRTDTLLLERTKEDHEKNDKCFDQKLYQILKVKWYLVALGDIWDIQAWDDLRPSFPYHNNVSRIIFTTRSQAVAMQTNSFLPLALRLISESLKLLIVRVFKKKLAFQNFCKLERKLQIIAKAISNSGLDSWNSENY
jgi:hypothetical protein